MGIPAIYLKKGSLVGAPASDEVALIAEADGTVKSLAADGTRSQVGDLPIRQTLAVDAQDVDFSSLNGDLDGDYELTGRIVIPGAGTFQYTIQPNALSTNKIGIVSSGITGGGGVTIAALSDMNLGGITVAGAGAFLWFRARLAAKTGFQRSLDLKTSDFAGAGGQRRLAHSFVDWTDTAAVITSIRIHCDTAAGIKTGSSFVLRKLVVHTAV